MMHLDCYRKIIVLSLRQRRREKDDKDDNDSDNVEKRNPIDWGEDIPEGDLSAFVDLGSNARVLLFFFQFFVILFFLYR